MFSEIEERSWLDLHEDEEVEWWCHPTILMYIPKLAFASVIFVAIISLSFFRGFVPTGYYLPALALVSLAPLAFIGYQLLHWRSKYYVVTNHRVIRKDGIISRRINPANFSRISNIKSSVSAFERIVSFFIPNHSIGDLKIHTADDNMGDILFKNVKDVNKGLEVIQSNLSEYSTTGSISSPNEE